MTTNTIYPTMIQPKGMGYRDSQVIGRSHYQVPIDVTPGRLAGNSHIWGDASPQTQSGVIDLLIESSRNAGLTPRQTAYVLAIARVESGFNPDAAAGTTSAYGLGQFIDRTAQAYGINDVNRHDVAKNSQALVAHYLDNRKLTLLHGHGEEYIYKYHHDGPTSDYGGLALSQKEVMPYVDRYEIFVRERLHQPARVDLTTTQKQRALDATVPIVDNNQAISHELQNGLNALGYGDIHGHRLVVDGDVGPRTQHAIRAFQHAHALQADGIAGAKTMEALSRARVTPLPVDPCHPDHALYTQTLHAVHRLDKQVGRPSDHVSDRLAASLTCLAKTGGLTHVDHVVLSIDNSHGKSAENVFAVQGRLTDPAHLRVHMPTLQAIQTPVAESFQHLYVFNSHQRQEAGLTQAKHMTLPFSHPPHQEEARLVHSR